MAVSVGDAFVDVRPNLATFNSEMAAAFSGASMRSKMGGFGKAAGVALGAGFVAAGVGKVLFDVGEEFDSAMDKIETRTGATGKRLGALGDDLKDVFASVPVSLDDASTALSGIAQRMDLPHAKLRALTKQVLALSKITGTDVQENVESITRLFGDWSVKTGKQAETLDKLFRLTQTTGIEFSTLSRDMVQFGSPLRQLGFSFDEAAAMFARFEREGVNMQTLLPGLKMALKNILVPTDDLKAKFKELGISTKDPKDALTEIMGLLSSDRISDTDKAFLGSKVFGGRAFGDMKAAIEEGRFAFGDLINEMKNGKNTIRGTERDTRDFSEEWQLFTNRLKVAIEPAATAFFHAIGDAMKEISSIIGDKRMDWSQKLSALLDLFTGWLGKLTEAAVKAAPKVVGALVKGFLDAPAWAKLAIGGFLVAKMGGWAAIKGLGGRIGTSLFGGIFGSKVPGTTGGIGGTIAARGTTPANPVFVSVVGPGGLGPGGKGVPPVLGAGSRLRGLPGLGTAGLIGLGISGFASAGAPGVENTPGNKLNAFAHGADPTRVLHLVGLPAVSDLLPTVNKNPSGDVVAIMRDALGLPNIDHPLDLPRKTSLGPAGGGPPISHELFAAAMNDVEGLLKATDVSGGRISDIVDSLRAKYGSLAKAASNMTKEQAHSFLALAVQAKTPKPALAELATAFGKAGKLSGDDVKQLAKITGQSAAEIRGASDKTASKWTNDQQRIRQATDATRDKVSSSVAKQTANVLASYGNLSHGVSVGLGQIRDNTNAALKALGLDKAVQFRTNEAPLGAGGQGHRAPKRRGGLAGIVPGADTGDRHVLSVDGNPIAAIAGAEGIFVGNSRMMRGLNMWNRLLPRRKGGVVVTPGQTRSYPGLSGDTDEPTLDALLSRMAQATGTHISINEGARTMAEQAARYAAYQAGTGNLAAAPTPNAPHVLGIAADISPGQEVFGGVAGRYGLGFPVPGESWHIQILSPGQTTVRGGGTGAAWKDIPRVVLIGPKGRTRDVGQRSLDKAWRQANAFGRRKASSALAVGGGTVKGLGGGVLSKNEIRKLLQAHGMPDIMGYVAYAESGFDPNAQNALYKGLWAEGQPFWNQFGGNKFGPWLPNVFDPNAAAAVASAGYKSLGLSPWEASRNAGGGGGWGSHLGQPFRRGGLVSLPWYGGGADFVARRPQVIGVGDGPRPERVRVEPIGAGGGRRTLARIVNWAAGWAEIVEIADDAANAAVDAELAQQSRTNRLSRSGRADR